MNLLIAAKLSDHKLSSILEPLTFQPNVEIIYLVRRYPFEMPKVKCYCPPKALQKNRILSEICRFFIMGYLATVHDINFISGIHYRFHCIYAAIFGMLYRIPILYILIEDPQKYIRNWWFYFFMRRAKFILVRGENSRKFLGERVQIEASKIDVLKDVLDFDDIHSQLPSNVTKAYDLAFVGAFSKEKRLDILMEVLSLLKRKKPDVKLLLIGSGTEASSLKEIIQENHLGENIVYTGYLSNEKIYSHLIKAKVFIMTSSTEGLPVAMIEALACGLPFVVPHVGDMRDVAHDGINAKVVRALNVQEFVQATFELLNDEEVYQKYVRGSLQVRDQLKLSYTREKVLETWKDVFECISQ